MNSVVVSAFRRTLVIVALSFGANACENVTAQARMPIPSSNGQCDLTALTGVALENTTVDSVEMIAAGAFSGFPQIAHRRAIRS